MQPDAFADAVVVMVKNALAPLQERLAAAEARATAAETKLATLDGLRDRIVVMETKALAEPEMPESPLRDLNAAYQRLAVAESKLADMQSWRVLADERIAIKAAPVVVPPVELPPPVDLSPVIQRLSIVEFKIDEEGVRSDRNKIDIEELTKENAALRERVAIAETRQFIPGPMGRDGQPGRDGKDGTNGIDGLGWDDLNVQQLDERTFAVKCLRGLQVKEIGTLTFPVEIYRGVYVEGKSYDRGDGVTWGGSEWHCNQTTTSKPGDGSKDWTLKVKRGRDGKDGRDANPLPVVSVGKR